MRCQRLDIDNLHVFLDRRRAPIVAEEFVTEKDIETGQPELRLALDSTRIRLAHLVDQAEAEPERCACPAVIASPSVC